MPLYQDVPAAFWGFSYVQPASELGLMSGCAAGKFCPDAPLLRSEMASSARKTLVFAAQ